MTAPKKTARKPATVSSSSRILNDLKLSLLLIIATIVSGITEMFLFILKTTAMAAIFTFPFFWVLMHVPLCVIPTCLYWITPLSTFALSCLILAVANLLFLRKNRSV